MNKAFYKIFPVLIFLLVSANAKLLAQKEVISNFNRISETPEVIQYTNKKQVRNKGGHLQGIQVVSSDDSQYAFVTGSSDIYSYYSVVKLDNKNKVISVNKLFDVPYKHSGGHQIFENFMAIGIEDNSKKDKSKVCIYDISDPESPNLNPVATIERKGKPHRSTSGCVGITNYKNEILVVVGDWDTKHLDFYSCKPDQLKSGAFTKVHTIIPSESNKSTWINTEWHSYQNINLFVFNNDELYLIGLGHNSNGEDIADLYQLHEGQPGKFELQKLASKSFQCKKGSNFKAGAGVMLDNKGRLQLYSCSYNINNISFLNHFPNPVQ